MVLAQNRTISPAIRYLRRVLMAELYGWAGKLAMTRRRAEYPKAKQVEEFPCPHVSSPSACATVCHHCPKLLSQAPKPLNTSPTMAWTCLIGLKCNVVLGAFGLAITTSWPRPGGLNSPTRPC